MARIWLNLRAVDMRTVEVLACRSFDGLSLTHVFVLLEIAVKTTKLELQLLMGRAESICEGKLILQSNINTKRAV